MNRKREATVVLPADDEAAFMTVMAMLTPAQRSQVRQAVVNTLAKQHAELGLPPLHPHFALRLVSDEAEEHIATGQRQEAW